MKVLVIVGTRPEVIKMAPVIKALREARVETIVCASGQHREMLAQALDIFGILPEVSLDVMSPGLSLNVLSARLLLAIDQSLESICPDWVLVQGDTTTALCGGLAAFHRGIRVGHIEAGLRTGNLASPFPEEANRTLLSRIASLHFAPTHLAAQALRTEGVEKSRIRITGNTVVDSIEQAQAAWPAGIPSSVPAEIEARLKAGPVVLVTCHRRENFGSVMEAFCRMLSRLSERHAELQWIFPVHLNPAVRGPVHRFLAGRPNLLLTDPVDYHTSLYIISHARLVVSDSGGIQEEAPSFGTPVVVMRQHTERMEGIHAGFATLAGQDTRIIEEAVDAWLGDEGRRASLRARENPYGDGRASTRILAALLEEPCKDFHG